MAIKTINHQIQFHLIVLKGEAVLVALLLSIPKSVEVLGSATSTNVSQSQLDLKSNYKTHFINHFMRFREKTYGFMDAVWY